jgi:LysM repeat protein
MKKSAHTKMRLMPSIIAVAGFLILGILLIAALSRMQDLAEKKQLSALVSRLEQLERQLAGLADVDNQSGLSPTSQKQFDLLTERHNRLDSTVSAKMDLVIKALENQKQMPVPKKGLGKETPQPVKKETKPKVHKVQTGETLYRISQRYGLTVEQLRDYNQLGVNPKIYPGQELKLTP